nr:MAG TPA: Pulmonary surfactant-associated protein D, c-type lectin, alpha-helical coiled [Caudoviricetes sp.]
MADTYTIQFRRGMYADFDTSKIRPGEPVAILGNDPSVPSGKALYIAFAANDVRRLCSIEDISEMVNAGEFVGPQGPKGEKGDKGDPGEKGADGTVAFESLTPEQKESLRGISIKSASVDTDGNLTIMFSDGDSEDVGNIMGPQGIQGPKGDKGDVGPQGLKGDKGDVGPKGDNMSDEQAAQIEQNKTDIASLKTETGSLKEDISNKITKFYASSQGESHLADSDNGKIMDMMVYGKSEQKQYSGKNLLNPTFETDTYSGVALTNNGDGTYTIEGTNNSSGELIFSLVRTVDEQKALYNSLIGKNVKFIVESGSTISGSVGRICFVFYNKTENRFSNETYNGGNVTVPTGYDSSVIDIHINVGQTVPKTILKPMIVDASLYPDATYDTFEPYTGGIPSPNPDYPQEIKSVVKPRVKVCGKNLLNTTLQTTTQSGVTFTANGDGTYTLNGIAKALIDVSLSKNFHIENGKMYRITGWVKNVSGSIYLVNGKDSAGDTGDGVTFTYIDATNDSKVIRIQIPKGAIINNVIIKPMICTDASATYDDFEPYHEQTVTLPYDLYGVKVPSGGNVTIDGQEYVSDYFDVERGKLVRMVDDVEAKNYTWNLYPNGNNMPRRFGMNDTIRFNMPADIRIMSSHFKQIAANTRTDLSTWFQTYYIAITDMNEKWKNSEALIQWFSENKVHFYLPLKTPTEIDLTSEEVQALKALTAYYPTTNISVNSEQLDGYTVFNYPISMENGWNYVKQQIGDTRDYIYDMDARTQDTDLQAAEAYVNSEYAVTLTELEV